MAAPATTCAPRATAGAAWMRATTGETTSTFAPEARPRLAVTKTGARELSSFARRLDDWIEPQVSVGLAEGDGAVGLGPRGRGCLHGLRLALRLALAQAGREGNEEQKSGKSRVFTAPILARGRWDAQDRKSPRRRALFPGFRKILRRAERACERGPLRSVSADPRYVSVSASPARSARNPARRSVHRT